MKGIIIFGIMAVIIMQIAGAAPLDEVHEACYEADMYNDDPRVIYCEDNNTLMLQYCYQVTACNQTDTESINCSRIQRKYCVNGCNNFTKACELFRGEEEYFNITIAWIIVIACIIIFIYAIYRAFK